MKNYFIVLVAFVFSACHPDLQTKYQDTKTPWQKEINQLVSQDKDVEPNSKDILFIGSSSIRLWDNMVQDMKPYTTIKRGYGGAKFTDLIHFVPDLVYPHEFQAVCIFVANDISGSDNDISPEEGLELYKNVIHQIRKKFKSTPIFYIGVTPTESRWKVWPQIEKFNNLIEDYSSKKKNLYYIDTEANFLNSEGKPRAELFRKDKLHLMPEGYLIWADYIKESLSNVVSP